MATLPRFYVYVLARPNATPFYVGKGSGPRIEDHEQEAARGHRCHKCNAIRKIWRNGGVVQRYIIFTTDDEQEAHDYECATIALHGRSNLCNGTDGGDGASGAVRSPETRARMSIAAKAAWADPEKGARKRAAGRLNDPDVQSRNTRWDDPAQRAMQSEIASTYLRHPDVVAQGLAAMRATTATDAYRAKAREVARVRWADPEYRAKQAAALRARWSSPEARAQASLTMKNSPAAQAAQKASKGKPRAKPKE